MPTRFHRFFSVCAKDCGLFKDAKDTLGLSEINIETAFSSAWWRGVRDMQPYDTAFHLRSNFTIGQIGFSTLVPVNTSSEKRRNVRLFCLKITMACLVSCHAGNTPRCAHPTCRLPPNKLADIVRVYSDFQYALSVYFVFVKMKMENRSGRRRRRRQREIHGFESKRWALRDGTAFHASLVLLYMRSTHS